MRSRRSVYPKRPTSRTALGWALPLSYVSLSAVALGQTSDAPAQTGGSEAAETGGTTTSNPGSGPPVTVEFTPPAAAAPQVFVPGYPQPGTVLDAHLPSGSRAHAPGETDSFDLHGGNESGSGVVQGSGEAILLEPQLGSGQPMVVPPIHVVKQGDTLWDLSGQYYQNPWNWPQVCSLNPQVKDPHWIYPGTSSGCDPAAPFSRAWAPPRVGARVV